MGDFTCPGCGKRLKNLNKFETHAKQCRKWARVIRLSYNIPTVNIKDLAHLEAKQLPNNKGWGIWNTNGELMF